MSKSSLITYEKDRKGGGGGNSPLSFIFLVSYIVLKYPIKYGVLLSLFSVMIMLIKLTYEYACKTVTYIIKFFTMILNPGDLDLIIFKLPNIFTIFMAFLNLFIGMLYACVALILFIGLGAVSLPFNMIFGL